MNVKIDSTTYPFTAYILKDYEKADLIEGLYPRKCDISGKGFTEGWCIGDGMLYVSSETGEESAVTLVSENYDGYDNDKCFEDKLDEMYKDELIYYSEWECNEEEMFTENGTMVYLFNDEEEMHECAPRIIESLSRNK